MSDADYQGQQLVYFLDFRIPGADSERIPVIDKITVGSAEDVEVSVDDFGLAPRHGIFRVHNDILSLHNLGGSDNSFIGKQPLIQGKMYIIDKGDKISLGDLEFIVRTEEVENTKAFKIAVGNDESEISVADILSQNKENDEELEEAQKESIFSRLFSKIKKIFVKKTIADDELDMSLSSGIPKQSRAELMLSQSKGKQKRANSSNLKNTNHTFFANVDGAKPIPRIFAIILNFIIFQSVYYIYIPKLDVQKHIDKATELAIKYINIAVKEVLPFIPTDYTKYLDVFTNQTYISIVIIFLALELMACLILGVNLGQALVRISGDGSFLGKRIKGLFRSVIGLFTAPFLIFDIPAFMGNKTLKEVLSNSQIGHKSDGAKAFGTYIFFPIFFCLLSFSPLLENLDNLKFPAILYESPRIEKGKITAYKASSRLLNSNINISKFKNLIFIPELVINKNKQSSTKITLLDLNKGTNATLSIEKMKNNYKKLVQVGLTGHPFASLMYPALTSEQSSYLGDNATLELEKLMINSFKLSPEETISILTDHGPFFIGISKIRELILKKHFIKHPRKVGIIKKESHHFITLGDNKDLAIIYLLNPQYPIIAKLNFKTKSNSIGEKLFIATLKSSSLISRKKQKKSSYVKKLKSRLNWNAFDTLDFYSYLETIPKKVDAILLSRYRKFSKKIGKRSLSSGNKTVIKHHIKALKSTEKALNRLRIPNITSLKRSISEDITALNNRKLNYFDK